ncbi:site-specific DNA-methyltransferase [Paracoccus sp. (in: a-proteobacteria)]|uniref:site-specific DNA-methyltransferase n=1 Tax=Paracoccus sp. TaxID=267 RepID=UPI00321FC2CB
MPLLHWLTRDQDLTAADRVPYRLLDEVAELSVPAAGADGNLLVQGDNLEALRALLPFYAGRVKCIYIDPPYNTGSAFEHYDDSLEHAKWLAMMVPRLQLLREFLREDGSIWVSIDDREGHYLKVVMDEVFGRGNFVATFVWERDAGGRGDAAVSVSHDFILAYAKQSDVWKKTRNLLPRTDVQSGRFRNPDNDPRGPWRQGDDGTAKSGSEKQRFPIELPSGRAVTPKPGRYWAFSQATFERARAEGRVYFGKNGDRLPIIKRYLDVARDGVAPRTWWPASDAGTNQSAKRDHLSKLLPNIGQFDTPKPEELIGKIITIATNPGDLVLDSFLGSGTTAAVAQKMGRAWIGVEMGDHARTHCALRLKKVIEGEQGGISADVGWQGGGGFRFCTLGAAVFDGAGQINPAIRFADLARHLWFSEFRVPLAEVPNDPFLGVQDGHGLALLYNGILKDRAAGGGNVLTHAVMRLIRDAARAAGHDGPITVYGAANRLSEQTLNDAGVRFRQTPWDIKARA